MGRPMMATVAMLTLRNLLGRRRALLMLALPGVLLLLSLILRLTVQESSRPQVTAGVLGGFALATLVPLLGLLAGTGAIGPEIDDGSIVYLLSKPVSRYRLVVAKLAVAVLVVVVFAALPILVAGLLLNGTGDGLAVGFFVAALVGGTAYCAVFLLLAVVTRNAVVVGLIYALVWESLVGSFVPGAKALSIQQWGLSLTQAVIDTGRAEELGVTAAVRLPVAVPLLVIVLVAATAYAGHRLRALRLTNDD